MMNSGQSQGTLKPQDNKYNKFVNNPRPGDWLGNVPRIGPANGARLVNSGIYTTSDLQAKYIAYRTQNLPQFLINDVGFRPRDAGTCTSAMSAQYKNHNQLVPSPVPVYLPQSHPVLEPGNMLYPAQTSDGGFPMANY